jgi:hypothetical protein
MCTHTVTLKEQRHLPKCTTIAYSTQIAQLHQKTPHRPACAATQSNSARSIFGPTRGGSAASQPLGLSSEKASTIAGIAGIR